MLFQLGDYLYYFIIMIGLGTVLGFVVVSLKDWIGL